MTSSQELLANVQRIVETIKNDELQTFPEAATPGDYVRQGDVYITKLDAVPDGAIEIEGGPPQVAPGETTGSRHLISSLVGVTQYRISEDNPYDGPVLECQREVTLTHPEHGDWLLPPGIYAISYQRTVDSEGLIQRVQD